MLTPENTDLIKQSIFTLIFTLKNFEVCTFHTPCTFALSVSPTEQEVDKPPDLGRNTEY